MIPHNPSKDNSSTNKNPLEYALELAKLGFHVIPLPENGKKPPPTGWQKQSTIDPKQIKAWFENSPNNIGINTGKFGDDGKSLVVVDVDMKNGKDGEQSLKEVLGKNTLPETMVIKTPSGGRHIYFMSDTPFKTGVDVLGDGVDIRATGGYAVAPGSSIYGKHYTGAIRLPEGLPDFLAKMLTENITSANDEISSKQKQGVDTKSNIERTIDHLQAASPAIEGKGGDNYTNRLFNVIGDIGPRWQTAFDLARELWNPRCDPQWTDNELMTKVKSAYDSRTSPVGINPPGEGQFGDLSHLMSNDNRPEGNSAEGRNEELVIYSLSDLRDMPPATFLIGGLLPETGVAFLAGQSGDGKTFVTISLACSVANGANVGSRETIQKPVLMMLNEGQSGIYQRTQACIDYNQYLDTEDNFKVMAEAPDLMNSSSVDRFIARIEKEQYAPGLIILDVFAKATVSGDDNNANDMTKAVTNAYRLANKFDALILLIDHVGKDVKKGVRGSSAKYGGADMIGIVTKNGDIVSLKVMKQKEAEDGMTIDFAKHMQANTTGDGGETPVLVPNQEFNSVPVQTEWILAKLKFEGEHDRETLQAAFIKVYGADKIKNFKANVHRLKIKRLIQVDGELLRIN